MKKSEEKTITIKMKDGDGKEDVMIWKGRWRNASKDERNDA